MRIKQNGIVGIPVLIALMALILAVSLAVGSVSFNQNEITLISNDGARALSYAEAGAKDALQRITQDISYTDTNGYDLELVSSGNCPDGCANVTVHSNVSPKVITVTGQSGSAIRKIQVDVAYNSSFGITNVFWNEIKDLPTVSTGAATGVDEDSATLTGWTNPNGNSVEVWFRHSPFQPDFCADDFGTRLPSSGGISPAPGSGTDPVTFSADTGAVLEDGVTYYYCAIGDDGNGDKVYGQIFSFTASGTLVGGSIGLPPTVTTFPATDITDSFGNFTATLNGSASPNGLSTTGWFRYSTTNPVVCNNTFGNRAPGSGGTSLGAGGTAVPYSEDVSLLAETEYFFCALASNSLGTGVGLIESFTTPSSFPAGMVWTGTNPSPASIRIYKRSGDVFNQVGNFEAGGNTGYSSSFTSDDIYLAVPHSAGDRITIYKGSGDDFTELTAPTVLPTSIPRHANFSHDDRYLVLTTDSSPYILIYKRSGDTFNSISVPALLGAGKSSSFSSDDAYLAVAHSGTVPPDQHLTIYKNNGDDTFTKLVSPDGPDTPPAGLGGGVAFSNDDAYLAVAHSTTPYLTIYKNNGDDTFTKIVSPDGPDFAPPGTGSGVVFSPDGTYLAFTSSISPYLTIYKRSGDAFTRISSPSTTPTPTNPDVFPAGTSRGVNFSNDGVYLSVAHNNSPYMTVYKLNTVDDTFTKLVSPNGPDTTPAGSGQAAIFTKKPLSTEAPKAFTYGADPVSFTEATLNGSGNPKGGSTTGYFRYSTTNPGTCNDSFGTRAPTSGGDDLGSGISTIEYSESLTGLSLATTYYFCAITTSSEGTAFGRVLSFVTLI